MASGALGPGPGSGTRGSACRAWGPGHWARGPGTAQSSELGAAPLDPSPFPEPGGVTLGPRRGDQEEEWGGEGIGEGLVAPDFRAQGSNLCEERALGEGLRGGDDGRREGRWGEGDAK